MTTAQPKPPRDRDLAQIHIARKALALTDDTYRALLQRVTGKDSAADLSIGERGRVLAEFRRLGWRPKPGKLADGRKKSARPPRDDRAVALALWIQLHQAGEVEDPSDLALAAFARRMTGVDHWRWTRADGCHRIIEALKAWQARTELRTLWRRAHALGLEIAGDGSDAALARYLGRKSLGAIRTSDASGDSAERLAAAVAAAEPAPCA